MPSLTRHVLGLTLIFTLTGCGSLVSQPGDAAKVPQLPPDSSTQSAGDNATISDAADALGDTDNCPVVEPTTCPTAQPARGDKPIIGEVERIKVSPPDILLSARIDTGATTTSVNALDIEPFERDGRKWVRFQLQDDQQQLHQLERRLERTVSIKRHGADSQQRPVVKLQLSLAGITRAVEVSLADRSDFEYNLLIGRNFLRDTYAVDVSYKYHQPDGTSQ